MGRQQRLTQEHLFAKRREEMMKKYPVGTKIRFCDGMIGVVVGYRPKGSASLWVKSHYKKSPHINNPDSPLSPPTGCWSVFPGQVEEVL